MAAGKHELFQAPLDVNIPIWRYMDFAKYVAMLEYGGIFFPRADKLGDPFEGSFPEANKELRAQACKEIGLSENECTRIADIHRWLREWTMVCCWHKNYRESAAMWKLYSKTDKAVAIRATFARLRDCLDERTYVGVVKYLDYQKERIPEDNTFWPFLFKRGFFADDQEVRAVILERPPLGEAGLDISAPAPRDGIWKLVDLSALVDAVFVAPASPDWFWELVQKVTARHLPGVPVTRSALDEKPFY